MSIKNHKRFLGGYGIGERISFNVNGAIGEGIIGGYYLDSYLVRINQIKGTTELLERKIIAVKDNQIVQFIEQPDGKQVVLNEYGVVEALQG